ncbi:hypothetical protein [Chryseobacterium gossypii]|uniref:hypothetical protein n=1 Tax=Chryseobacterium gossypii TaxID=3231602 RepID=UPI0035245ECE
MRTDLWKSQIIKHLQKGDTILNEFSRLEFSMLECMEIISITTQINIYSVKGNWQLGNIIQGKVMAMVFSMVSEI